jgi:5-formyltetrahydrofolate cyclo-ligase
VGDEVQLFRLEAISELVPGTFGILEPTAELRELPPRQVLPSQIDLALVPGVVFDRQGNRLGYGRGFYDRLLRQLPREVLRVGLAFECQVVEELPVEPHDERMDWLVTEAGVRRFAAG